MTIALFTDCYIPIKNGVVTSVNQLKNGLEEKGHTVLVITVDVPNYEETDKCVYRLPSFKLGLGGTEQRVGFVNQGAVNRFLKKKNVELIHTHTEFSIGYCGKNAAKKLKIPHVHTTHTMWEDYRHYILNGKLISVKMARKIMNTFLKNVSVFIAPSIKAKKYYSEVNKDVSSVVINNGIDMQKFKSSVILDNEMQQLRKSFGIKKNDRIIIFVGRMGKEKRIFELFNAVLPILKESSDVKMVFVGDGPQITDISDLAEENNLENSVVFTGFVNWELVYRFYSIADIFVTASLSEVHPMTLIEATMCALPIIARRDDSYMDLVKDNGFLVDTDEEITEKLKYILENEYIYNDFREASLKLSMNFTAEHHVSKVERLYKEVIKNFPGKIPEDFTP